MELQEPEITEKAEFPPDFLWGVASSAAQYEGAALEDGKKLSIWDVFSRIPGAIADETTPDVACDFYHRYREDVALMKRLGIRAFRFSISWPRVMPDGVGAVNQKGLDFYKSLTEELLKNGIVPCVTLYHWDLPHELECRGGWLNRDCADWFAEYAGQMFRALGDSIPLWATLNEPIATYVGYAGGGFAPGRKLELFGRQANHHILLAHGRALQAFRAASPRGAKAGVVVDVWHHHPARRGDPGDEALALRGNELTYRSYLGPIFRGRYSDYLLRYLQEEGCMPDIREDDLSIIGGKLDFFGLNCYNRVVCSSRPEEDPVHRAGGNFLDNGTEFYPRAVYDALRILRDDYGVTIPIYITENGVSNCSETPGPDGIVHDGERIRYLRGFLSWLSRAMREGIDVKGYFLWSLLDNYEWNAGFTSRFGIVHVNYDTQSRTCKDSARFYADVIRNGGF